MIIRLNGPFGSGKTTLAEKLRERRPDLLLFDPEEVGFIVKSIVPPATSGDYQDLPLWCSLTLAALAEIRRHFRQDFVVPMTLVRPDYLHELLNGARLIDRDILHVFLTLDEQILRKRIAQQRMHPDPIRDARIRRWRLAQIERCMSAKAIMPAGIRFLDSGVHSADALADKVLAQIIGGST